MIKVLFVCLGNICRSPMAEFIFKDMVKKKGLSKAISVSSAAASSSTMGMDMYEEAKIKLRENEIPYNKHKAKKLLKEDYQKYDYIIGMDNSNIENIMYIVNEDPNNKVYKLLDFTDEKGEVADPWYTGNFTKAYNDIEKGCKGLLEFQIREHKLMNKK